jgi:hypothetical protein
MLNKIVFVYLLIFIVFCFSCKKTYDPSYNEVLINELMPVNTITVTDNYGQYDDWIELFNPSASVKDLSGYYLSDSKSNNTKWTFPVGTTIIAHGYLIIWADKDTTQLGLHANFKLSSSGEKVVLSNPSKIIIDDIEFTAQTMELSFSRVPDGTGDFRWQNPTFNRSNNNK